MSPQNKEKLCVKEMKSKIEFLQKEMSHHVDRVPKYGRNSQLLASVRSVLDTEPKFPETAKETASC